MPQHHGHYTRPAVLKKKKSSFWEPGPEGLFLSGTTADVTLTEKVKTEKKFQQLKVKTVVVIGMLF